MPIADLQRRDTEVGRIRLGKKTATGRADRLDTFRFTSADQAMIEEIAALYGGTPSPWMNEKKRQFEVITTTAVIPVYIPPQIVDPWYENWGGGACLRRCDGIRDIIQDKPCDCATDSLGKKSKCKPTTRVNLYLAEVQGMGVWRLETHGIYAAGEMVQLSERINGIKIPLPARLALEQRGAKKFNREKGKVETLDYNVPVLWLDSITSRHIALGEDAVSQVVRAAAAQQIEAAEAVPALPAAPAPQAVPAARAQAAVDPAVIQRGLALIASATAEEMGDIHGRIVKMDSPPVLVEAFQKRLGELEVLRQQAEAHAASLQDGAMDGDEGESWSEEHEGELPPVVGAIDDAIAAGASAPWSEGEREQMLAAAVPAATNWATAAPVATPEPEKAPPGTETPPVPPAAPEATEDTSGDKQAAMTRLLTVGNAKGHNRKALDEHMLQQHGCKLKEATTQQLAHLAEWIGG